MKEVPYTVKYIERPIAPTNHSTERYLSDAFQCPHNYYERRYLSKSKLRPAPPLLYSFPGSGNTWVRQLIEYATGIYSGSIYDDKSLTNILPGELECNNRQSVIKVHPNHFDFNLLQQGRFGEKCHDGNINSFGRAILLIRNPYDAIWSEYERRRSKSHSEGVLRSAFNRVTWLTHVRRFSSEYLTVWLDNYHFIENSLNDYDYLYVKYEDLRNVTKRTHKLKQIIKFLDLPTSLHRIACAFPLAENNVSHRIINETLEITKDEAYTPDIVCGMWKIFGVTVSKYYGPWKGLDCSGLSHIEMHDMEANNSRN
jgi:Sulfotransferase domain